MLLFVLNAIWADVIALWQMEWPLQGVSTSLLVPNTQDFIQQIKDIKLQEDKCMVSFDVKVLFTSVP